MIENIIAGGLGLGILAFILFTIVAWIWALVHLLASEKSTNEKILWALVILFAGFIGAIIYYFLEVR